MTNKGEEIVKKIHQMKATTGRRLGRSLKLPKNGTSPEAFASQMQFKRKFKRGKK